MAALLLSMAAGYMYRSKRRTLNKVKAQEIENGAVVGDGFAAYSDIVSQTTYNHLQRAIDGVLGNAMMTSVVPSLTQFTFTPTGARRDEKPILIAVPE